VEEATSSAVEVAAVQLDGDGSSGTPLMTPALSVGGNRGALWLWTTAVVSSSGRRDGELRTRRMRRCDAVGARADVPSDRAGGFYTAVHNDCPALPQSANGSEPPGDSN
jgi:hypothetical protein